MDHADEAIRIYDSNEIVARHANNIINSGKCGKRIKIFEIQGHLDQELWANIACSFFVWNYDLRDYFMGSLFKNFSPE
jgi:hypothetical protein